MNRNSKYLNPILEQQISYYESRDREGLLTQRDAYAYVHMLLAADDPRIVDVLFRIASGEWGQDVDIWKVLKQISITDPDFSQSFCQLVEQHLADEYGLGPIFRILYGRYLCDQNNPQRAVEVWTEASNHFPWFFQDVGIIQKMVEENHIQDIHLMKLWDSKPSVEGTAKVDMYYADGFPTVNVLLTTHAGLYDDDDDDEVSLSMKISPARSFCLISYKVLQDLFGAGIEPKLLFNSNEGMFVVFPRLQIDDLQVQNLAVGVVNIPEFQDAILGGNFLRLLRSDFDFEHMRLSLSAF